MLMTDFKVVRPDKTKLIKRKNNAYVYHVTDSIYNKDKQYVVEKRACIGKMIDDEFMTPNDNYFRFYDNDSIVEMQPPEFSDTLKIGAVTLIHKAIKDVGLDDLLDSIYGKYGVFIKDLISYMIIEETSVMQHYPDFSWEHSILSERIWSDSSISDFFKTKMSSSDTQLFLNAWNRLHSDLEDIYISYDSTNMNTDAQGIDMAEFGHAKDDDDTPQVNLSYAVNQNDSTPLFYELYPGSIVDISQCEYMVKKAKDYGYKNIGFLLDRGYFSQKNIDYFDDGGFEFIMMTKGTSAIVKKAIEEVMIQLKTRNEYYLAGQGVYGKTVKMKLHDKDKKERFFHVYYDNIRAGEERNRILEDYEKIEHNLERKVNDKLRKEEELVKFKKPFKLKFDNNGYLQSYKRNDRFIQEQTDKLGFFVIITSKEMSADSALSIYRDRDSIEKLFRGLKSGMGYGAFRVHEQTSLESKTHITFIANIVRNYIFQHLKPLQEKDRKSFTVPAAINELERITITKGMQDKYKRLYGLTAKQKKILSQFNIDDKYLEQELFRINKIL